ncbi:MAG: hypothetical protein ACLUR5_05085 [Eubacterium ventriosum]
MQIRYVLVTRVKATCTTDGYLGDGKWGSIAVWKMKVQPENRS